MEGEAAASESGSCSAIFCLPALLAVVSHLGHKGFESQSAAFCGWNAIFFSPLLVKGESLVPAREDGKLRRGEGKGNSYFRQGGHTTIILHPDCPECLLAAVNLRNMGGRGKMSLPCLQILAGCLILDTNVSPATQDPDKLPKVPLGQCFYASKLSIFPSNSVSLGSISRWMHYLWRINCTAWGWVIDAIILFMACGCFWL